MPTGDITKCRSPKNGKNWGFSPPQDDRINWLRRNFAGRRVPWVCYSSPNLTVIGKRGSVQEPPKISKFVFVSMYLCVCVYVCVWSAGCRSTASLVMRSCWLASAFVRRCCARFSRTLNATPRRKKSRRGLTLGEFCCRSFVAVTTWMKVAQMMLLHFAWVVTRNVLWSQASVSVCLSAAKCLHCCTDLDVTWGLVGDAP